MKKVKWNIDSILDAKEKNGYYREQSFQSLQDVKLEVSFIVVKQRSKLELLWLLLDKLKTVIGQNGYIIKENDEKNCCYQIKLDPTSCEMAAYLFMKIKQVITFSEDLLKMKEIHLLFSRELITNYDKTHKKLLTFLLEESNYFLPSTIYIWDYKTYLNRQTSVNRGLITINYLKRSEIEIRNIKEDITPSELKNLMIGLLMELEAYPHRFYEKRRNYDRKKEHINRLMEELDLSSFPKNKQSYRKLLVYSLDRRTPVLLQLSEKTEQLIREETSKALLS